MILRSTPLPSENQRGVYLDDGQELAYADRLRIVKKVGSPAQVEMIED